MGGKKWQVVGQDRSECIVVYKHLTCVKALTLLLTVCDDGPDLRHKDGPTVVTGVHPTQGRPGTAGGEARVGGAHRGSSTARAHCRRSGGQEKH